MLSYCTANPMLICLTQKKYFPSSSWQICHFCYKHSTFFPHIFATSISKIWKNKILQNWRLCSHFNVENLEFILRLLYTPTPCPVLPLLFGFFLSFFVYFWWIAVGRTGTSKEKKGLHSYPDEISKMIMN